MNKIEKNRINICLSCDENYAQHAGVVIASILYNAKADDELYFYILDGNITQKSKDKILSLKSVKDCSIEFVTVYESAFDDYQKIETHYYISAAACYRLKLPSLLQKIDKVIYLDCDVIVCSDLKDLYNINMQGKLIAGVLDIDVKRKNYNKHYVNSGVLLMDLENMRKQSIEEEFILYAQQNAQNIKMGDQEIINSVLSDRILNIDEKFNVQSECFIRRSSFTKNPVIIHFIGDKKPWQNECWSVHKGLYYKYLQLTQWKLDELSLLVKKDFNKINDLCGWLKHRPFFYMQKKFWNAVKKNITIRDNPRIFVVILMARFGDIILCNSLFQNIKRLYPNSKTVFVVDKPWYEAAKYQKDVDEVITFDKRGKYKGTLGILFFLKDFPYKKIDYIFKIYDNERTSVLAFLLHPKKIIGKPYEGNVSVQERHNNLLKKITCKSIVNYPAKYYSNDDIPEKLKGILIPDKKNAALCLSSSRKSKDVPLETAIELIDRLTADNYEVFIVGAGNRALNYATKLNAHNCKFINLVNKTTIYELAQVLKNCAALISVDTGTMHFSYANDVPTVCIFYEEGNIKYWAPNNELYPHTYVSYNQSAEKIYECFNNLIKKCSKKKEEEL